MFIWDDAEHLILVDSYSGWFEVNTLSTTTSTAVIRKLKSHFAKYGIPNQVFGDSGPQYSSHEFAEFEDEWGFQHVTSSLNYPRSKGLADSFMKTAEILSKVKMSRSDPYIALLNYRNTRRNKTLGSPPQRLMSRQRRALLPVYSKKLKPVLNNCKIGSRLHEKRTQ